MTSYGPVGTGPLLFLDDFNGAPGAPNPARWEDFSTATYNSSAAYGAIKPGARARLDGSGRLIIPATPGVGTAIRSRGAWLYGDFSAWIQMPTQRGYWPAFWTLNNDPSGRDVFPLGEADVVEFYSTWPEAYHAVTHTWTGDKATQSGGGDWYVARPNLTTRLNKYTVRIQPNRVTCYFNDRQVGQPTLPVPGKPWGFGPNVTRPNWLILNLANDTRSGLEVIAPTEPARMQVGRVEVRALPPA